MANFEQQLDEILLDEGLLSFLRKHHIIPPDYWKKIDHRVIKTLCQPPTNDDLRWALTQVGEYLAPIDKQTLMQALKADLKGTVAKIQTEANEVLASLGRKATI